MPFSFARSARSLPTARLDGGLALALDPARPASSRLEAATSVLPLDVVDQLRVDVSAAAEHRQTRTARRARDPLANAIAANATPLVLVVLTAHDAAPAALPALRRMYSPSYLTPLPLYGSGGRNARMSAATWPTSALVGAADRRRASGSRP